VAEAWPDADASYVARLDISFLREIRRDGSPVRVHARLSRIGRSGCGVTMAVCSAAELCSVADGSSVARDGERRGSRAMTEAERAGLVALGGQHLRGASGT
jgi:acyl-CoA thioesterase FadM